jgi:ADP-heptose:LPS heptosyltransferase
MVARTEAPLEFEAARVKRVLMVATGLIGDTIMCLPALCAARELFPSAELTGLVTPRTRALLAMASCVDRFITLDAAALGLRPAARREAARVEAEVRTGAFDLAVIFLGDDCAPMLTRARIAHRVFVEDPIYAPLATATYSIGHPRTWGPRAKLDAWRALGLAPGSPVVRLVPPAEARASVAARVGVSREARPLLVAHPFGSSGNQWWPLQQLEELLQLAERQLGLECLVIGAGVEASRHASRDARFRLVDQLNLEELAALLATADYVVSTDSGPFHLAGILGRPGVGLFRASRPEHARHYPSIRPIIAPQLDACRGRCVWDRCDDSPCRQMSAISPTEVLEALRVLVGGVRRG